MVPRGDEPLHFTTPAASRLLKRPLPSPVTSAWALPRRSPASEAIAAAHAGPRGNDMELLQRFKGNMTTLRGVFRTLKRTTPIAKNPARVFPRVVEELARKFGDAPALLSDRESFSYRAL